MNSNGAAEPDTDDSLCSFDLICRRRLLLVSVCLSVSVDDVTATEWFGAVAATDTAISVITDEQAGKCIEDV